MRSWDSLRELGLMNFAKRVSGILAHQGTSCDDSFKRRIMYCFISSLRLESLRLELRSVKNSLTIACSFSQSHGR